MDGRRGEETPKCKNLCVVGGEAQDREKKRKKEEIEREARSENTYFLLRRAQ